MDKLFSERQHFRQIWLWVLLIAVNGIFIYGLFQQLVMGHSFGSKALSDGHLIAVTLLLFIMTLLFAFMRLDTEIRKDGIYYRFFPFQLSMKKKAWERISKSFVRQYNPLTEYGGWGVRMGIFGHGRALNVTGNKGLQLVYDNGKKLLLGTQKPDEVQKALRQLGH